MTHLVQGDCVEVMAAMVEASVDAICTDPPYGLEFMGKEWDRLDEGLPQEAAWKGRRGHGGASVGADGSTPGSRSRVGFGGKRGAFKRCKTCGKRAFSGSPCECENPEWVIEHPDGAPSSAIRMQRWHERWAREALRVLKPGGHLLAFGGTRTFHRLACALEDAGFEIRDTICWLYGSGFPKSLDVGKAIDRAAGAEREATGPDPYASNHPNPRGAVVGQNYGSDLNPARPTTAPATDAARQWAGWGTALKPAHGPIIVARKPLAGTVAANVLARGTGAINIAATRVRRVDPQPDACVCTLRSSLGLLGGTCAAAHAPVLDAAARIASVLRSCSSDGITRARGAGDLDGNLRGGVRCAERLVHLRFPNGVWCAPSSWSVPDFRGGCRSCRRSCDAQLRRVVESSQGGARQLADALEHTCSELLELERIRDCHCTVAGSCLLANVLPLLLSIVEGCDEGTTCLSLPQGRDGEASADRRYTEEGGTNFAATSGPRGGDAKGRWPANVVLSHLPECVQLGARRVVSHSPSVPQPALNSPTGSIYGYQTGEGRNGEMSSGYADADGMETVEAWECAEGCAVAALDVQSGVLTSGKTPTGGFVRHAPGDGHQGIYGNGAGLWGEEQDAGDLYGDSGGASRFFYTAKAAGDERWFYCRECKAAFQKDHEPRHRHGKRRDVIVWHPTVKPVDLMRWLVRLVTPPKGLVLDPFAGTGTTGVACIAEGFRFVGVERDPEYLAIAEARLSDGPLFA